MFTESSIRCAPARPSGQRDAPTHSNTFMFHRTIYTAIALLLPICPICTASTPPSTEHAFASPEERVTMLTMLAKLGDPDAQCELGTACYFGEGAPQSYEQATYWYRKAAEQNHAEAQYNLGVCYEQGQGVPQSAKLATYWYTQAAEQGFELAQETLKLRK